LYKVIQTSRLYEQIVQQIEASILKGVLKPGDQLPAERDLAQQFGVSRTAVREAVKALREKGLLEALHGRGTFIKDGTSKAVRQSLDLMIKIGQPDGSIHLAEVREILEPEIAALAATRIEEQHFAMMREAIAMMDNSLTDDPEAFIEGDLDFHLALAEAAANPLILSLLDSIVGLSRATFEDFLCGWRPGARPAPSPQNFRGRRTSRRGARTLGNAHASAAGSSRFVGAFQKRQVVLRVVWRL
jgi:GntR family transcriptional repressor for pyruvate dehydrogenase complex